MTTANFSWIDPHRGGQTRKAGKDTFLRISMSERPSGVHRSLQCTLTFYPQLMKLLRLVPGDRIRVGAKDDASELAFKRVTTGGYALGVSGGGEPKKSGATTGVVKFSCSLDLGRGNYTEDEILIDDDGCVIVYIKRDEDNSDAFNLDR
jgi:hypothetical protein